MRQRRPPRRGPDLDKEFRFQLEELGREKITIRFSIDTVGFHGRCVFLCYKSHEDLRSGLLASLLSACLATSPVWPSAWAFPSESLCPLPRLFAGLEKEKYG